MKLLSIILLAIVGLLLVWTSYNRHEFVNHWNEGDVEIGHRDLCVNCHEDDK